MNYYYYYYYYYYNYNYNYNYHHSYYYYYYYRRRSSRTWRIETSAPRRTPPSRSRRGTNGVSITGVTASIMF